MLTPVAHEIEAIFFDMNNTLRIREAHEPTQRASIHRILDLLGIRNAPAGFWDELAQRFSAYSQWAQGNLIQLSETDIWTSWILPDYPIEQVAPVAAELTLAWSERKGRTIPIQEAQETLVELKHRGYRLGLISNSMSSLDIPRFLEIQGWKDHFEVVILSSALKFRKPAPEPFWEAARVLNVAPVHCAYLGNRISRDVVGSKRAGFAIGMIIDAYGQHHPDEREPTIEPDFIIHSLMELRNLFPTRVAGM